MSMKTILFAGALALAAGTAAANAAPHGGGMMMSGHHMDAMHDHGHRPPMRVEHRPPMPHGHYRWHDGAWGWRNGTWAWTPGIWIRF
ncbi:MAG TPA: hypothetical protein VG387_22250 [Rhizomicrobium sp.]|jgi:hypothetical protein|nr:hypothetical protein [Rhizomicrobium sp.]